MNLNEVIISSSTSLEGDVIGEIAPIPVMKFRMLKHLGIDVDEMELPISWLSSAGPVNLMASMLLMDGKSAHEILDIWVRDSWKVEVHSEEEALEMAAHMKATDDGSLRNEAILLGAIVEEVRISMMDMVRH